MGTTLLAIGFMAAALVVFGLILKLLRLKEPWRATHDARRSGSSAVAAGPAAIHGASYHLSPGNDQMRELRHSTSAESGPMPLHGYGPDPFGGDSSSDGSGDAGDGGH
jgi:hypothetical protein